MRQAARLGKASVETYAERPRRCRRHCHCVPLPSPPPPPPPTLEHRQISLKMRTFSVAAFLAAAGTALAQSCASSPRSVALSPLPLLLPQAPPRPPSQPPRTRHRAPSAVRHCTDKLQRCTRGACDELASGGLRANRSTRARRAGSASRRIALRTMLARARFSSASRSRNKLLRARPVTSTSGAGRAVDADPFPPPSFLPQRSSSTPRPSSTSARCAHAHL